MGKPARDDVRDDLGELRSVLDWVLAELDLRQREGASPDLWVAERSHQSFVWLTREARRAIYGREACSQLRTLRARYEAARSTWALAEAVDAVERHFAHHEDDLDPRGEYEGPIQVARHPALRRQAAVEMCVQLYYSLRLARADSTADRLALTTRRVAEGFARTSEIGSDAQKTRWLRGDPIGEQTPKICALLDDERALSRKVPASYSMSAKKRPRALALAMVSKVIGESFDATKKKYEAEPKRATSTAARTKRRPKSPGKKSAK